MNSQTQLKSSVRRHGALLCIAAAAAFATAGCGAPVLTKAADDQRDNALSRSQAMHAAPPLADQAGNSVRGGAVNADRAALAQRNAPVVRRASAPFIGSTMVPATSEDRLPSIFQEPFTIDFSDSATGNRGAGGISLAVAMARLSRLTGVPIRIQPDVYSGPMEHGASGPGMAAGAPMPMPSPLLINGVSPSGKVEPTAVAAKAHLQSVTSAQQGGKVSRDEAVSSVQPMTIRSVEMKFNGTIASYLNRLTDRLGLTWEYRDNTIVVSRFVIEIHEVFTVAGSQKYSMGSGGSSSGSSGGSGSSGSATSTADISESGESNVMASMEKTIGAMIAEVPSSTVTRSDGSGRLVVKTSREMQSRVRDYIKAENTAMRRQAQIQFDIYSVTVEDSDQHGIDWTAALASLSQPALKLALSAPSSLADATSGMASVNVLGGVGGKLSDVLGNSSMIVQALTEKGYSVQHRPVSLLALNRQWARTSRLGTEYYLSETTPGPASSTGVGAPGLKTDKVTTGDRYVAMPQILDDNTIMLKFDMSLSDLLGLFDVTVGTGATAQKVQAPKTSSVSVQMPVALRPGEVVAITGLSRDIASSNQRTLGENISMNWGGSKKVSTKREYFLIFVRAIVL